VPLTAEEATNTIARMGGEADSGRRQDEQEAVKGSGTQRAGVEPDDESDWLESFRDVRFSWDTPGQERGSPLPSGDNWLFSFQPEREGDESEEPDAELETDRPSVDLPDDWSRAPSDVAGPPSAADAPRVSRSPRRMAVVAPLVVLLVVVGAVVGVALIGRGGGTESSSSGRSTNTVPRSAVTSTTAPATAPSTVPVPSTPAAFTVHATCAGRDCSLAVHDVPGKAAKRVGSLRSGDVVQVACSTHGELVADKDTGQQSDVWYRLADRPGYTSAAYLQGPTVPDCG
jgi:hypothetical protein